MTDEVRRSVVDRFYAQAIMTRPRAMGFGAVFGFVSGSIAADAIRPLHHLLETHGLPPVTAGGAAALGLAAVYGTLFPLPTHPNDRSAEDI
jgi:hypothetical protein